MAKGVQPSGNDYFEDAKQFQPVVDRLRALGPDALTAGSMGVREFTRTARPPTRVINIPGLERAGYKVAIVSGADVFLQRVAEVVKFPPEGVAPTRPEASDLQGKLSRR
jgi:hypothetical protein